MSDLWQRGAAALRRRRTAGAGDGENPSRAVAAGLGQHAAALRRRLRHPGIWALLALAVLWWFSDRSYFSTFLALVGVVAVIWISVGGRYLRRVASSISESRK